MRNKHLEVDGSTVTFRFRGKSGVKQSVDITDRRIAKIVQRCEDLPGYDLFQYVEKAQQEDEIDELETLRNEETALLQVLQRQAEVAKA